MLTNRYTARLRLREANRSCGPCTASTGALWKCPAWGRPVNVELNLKVGEAGAPSPLEISRAIVADHACTGAARFPHSHSGRRR
jgi:hypothetical protein